MKTWPALLALALLARLAPACAAEAWPERFDMVDASAAESEARIATCLGVAVKPAEGHTLSERLAQQRFARQPFSLVTEAGTAQLLAANGHWTCVPLSRQGHPIWPISALASRLRLPGVSDEARREFYVALLTEIARSGSAVGTMPYHIGLPEQIIIQTRPAAPGEVRITRRRLEQGMSAGGPRAVTLREAVTAFVTPDKAKVDDSKAQFVLSPLDTYWPVVDEFAVIPPGERSVDSGALPGRWLGSGVAISLLEGGLATSAGRTGAITGQWEVTGAAVRVRMNDGMRFTLTVASQPDVLEGIARRDLPPFEPGDPTDLQVPVRLKRQP